MLTRSVSGIFFDVPGHVERRWPLRRVRVRLGRGGVVSRVDKAGWKAGRAAEGGQVSLWCYRGMPVGSLQYGAGAVWWGVVVGLDVGLGRSVGFIFGVLCHARRAAGTQSCAQRGRRAMSVDLRADCRSSLAWAAGGRCHGRRRSQTAVEGIVAGGKCVGCVKRPQDDGRWRKDQRWFWLVAPESGGETGPAANLWVV